MKFLSHSQLKAKDLCNEQVVTVQPAMSVESVRRRLLALVGQVSSINYIYVVNAAGRLVGTVSIKELMQADKRKPIDSIMSKALISVRPSAWAERAAMLALKHSIKSVPVVTKQGELLGIIGSDDILKVAYAELSKDLLQLSGLSTHIHQFDANQSLFLRLKQRIPWILVGLIGGAGLAQIMSYFEHVLVSDVMFVPFIPLVVYIANAVGVQSQTLFIRAYSQDSSFKSGLFLFKQLLEAVGIGLFTLLGIMLLTSLIWQSTELGVIVGIAMGFAVIVATLLAIGIPLILIRFKQDPAIGSGPFATLLQDSASVLLYLTVISLAV